MGRRAFVRNHLLWMSFLISLVGMALVLLSYMADYAVTNWTDPYEEVVPGGGAQDWNLFVRVVSPIILLFGLWYVGEQLLARRKFYKVMNESKKSEFLQRATAIEDTVRKLPKRLEHQLDEKEASFKSRR